MLPLLFANGKYKVKQRPVDIALHLMEEVKLEYNKIVRSWKANGIGREFSVRISGLDRVVQRVLHA